MKTSKLIAELKDQINLQIAAYETRNKPVDYQDFHDQGRCDALNDVLDMIKTLEEGK